MELLTIYRLTTGFVAAERLEGIEVIFDQFCQWQRPALWRLNVEKFQGSVLCLLPEEPMISIFCYAKRVAAVN